jgi:hypothetical protein
MSYKGHPINCDNYSWYARFFNRPDHEIENDLRVWDDVASLIDSDLPSETSKVQASSPSGSPFFNYIRRGLNAQDTVDQVGNNRQPTRGH